MSKEKADLSDKNRDPEEYKRFLEAAKTAEASDDPKDLERVFRRIAGAKPPPVRKRNREDSAQ